MKIKLLLSAVTCALTLGMCSQVRAQQPTTQERVLALKASLAASKALLKQYQWVETTVVTLKGEEKSRKQQNCYYGVDGNVQKILLTPPPAEKKQRGLRGRIAAEKKEEMADYMKEAVGMVKQYIPPDPMRIQMAKDAGKVSVTPLGSDRVRLTFTDFLKPGDSLVLTLDLASNRPMEAKVTTYLDDSKDQPVSLDVKFSTLPNNATYASTIALDAKGKNLAVNVENSGYRPMGNQ
jgi:hypothetical protein